MPIIQKTNVYDNIQDKNRRKMEKFEDNQRTENDTLFQKSIGDQR